MITKFKQFEGSYFHSMSQIDEILDKITDYGYENLDDSDKSILLNFSKDDEDIHNILLKMNKLTNEFCKVNKRLSVLTKNDSIEVVKKIREKWILLNRKMSRYENTLRNVYKIEDAKDIWDYQQKNDIA